MKSCTRALVSNTSLQELFCMQIVANTQPINQYAPYWVTTWMRSATQLQSAVCQSLCKYFPPASSVFGLRRRNRSAFVSDSSLIVIQTRPEAHGQILHFVLNKTRQISTGCFGGCVDEIRMRTVCPRNKHTPTVCGARATDYT